MVLCQEELNLTVQIWLPPVKFISNMFSRFPACKSSWKCAHHFNRPSSQHLRCTRPEIQQSSHEGERFWQSFCHGDRPKHRLQWFAWRIFWRIQWRLQVFSRGFAGGETLLSLLSVDQRAENKNLYPIQKQKNCNKWFYLLWYHDIF